MIPRAENLFIAFDLVLSGKIGTGQKARILGPNYEVGKKNDLFQKSIQCVVIMVGCSPETGRHPCRCGIIGVPVKSPPARPRAASRP